jgi:molecular chaperone GrpE
VNLSSEEDRREPEERREDPPVEGVEPQGSAKPSGNTGDVSEEQVLDMDELAGEPEEEPGEGEEPSGRISALETELATARAERDQYLDALRRIKAEFDNSRKRQERDLARLREAAAERLVLELLPVLDNLDRALEVEGDIREGVRATRDQLMETLGAEGLLPVVADGQPFDPNVHEAVMGQPSEEHEDGTVLQTFQRGYVLKGKSIRPAKVVVARQV